MGYVNSQPRALDQTVPTARREPCVTTVLVVDDSAEARQQLRFLLEDGLGVQLMSKVPNWRFAGPYHVDFIGMRFRVNPSMSVGKKSR
jgi:hypothetical protein